MTDAIITFRTDEKLKKEATSLYESMGISLSAALNIFMKQSVAKHKFPCSIEAEIAENYAFTYPKGFFEMFGTDTDILMDEPEELSFVSDSKRISL